MKKFFYGMLFLLTATMFTVSCSKDDDDDKGSNNKGGGSSSTYCWDFLYQGSVFYSQCDLTEADADAVVDGMKKQGYTITKKRK